jgi:hypothetical protein
MCPLYFNRFDGEMEDLPGSMKRIILGSVHRHGSPKEIAMQALWTTGSMLLLAVAVSAAAEPSLVEC